MSGKNVLITGGAGFLGSHVTDRAMREGMNVTILDNLYTGTLDNLRHHETNPRFRFVKHDVSHPFPTSITSVKYDLIFHLACAASPVHYQADPIGTTMTCVNGTNHVLQEAMRCDCPALIASTSECYGDPLEHPQKETYWGNVNCTGVRSCYDEGKRCAEALCFDYNRRYGVKCRVARIFNTYGPRMCFNDGRIISNFVVQALKGEDITVYGTGEYTRSFQFCTDLVEGFWRLVHHPTEVGPVNLGNPVEYKVIEMAHMIKDMVPGTKSKIVHLEAAKDDPKQRRPDISKADAVLGGWKPSVLVAEGLKKTMEEFATRLSIQGSSFERLYVQCNPLLDISAHVSKAFLEKYGLKGADAIMAEEKHMPMYAEMEAMSGVNFIPGGSGLNTARVAQWMFQGPKGSFVSYVGCISDDSRGNLLKSKAEADGVTMKTQYSKNATGTCAVCIVDKERSMCANLSAANDLSVQFLDSPVVRETMAQSRYFYLPGFSVIHSLEHVMKSAARPNGVFCMNLSAPFIMQVPIFAERLKAVIPHIDVLFGNEDEAAEFGKMNGWTESSLGAIAAKAAALPKANANTARLVVFTHGSQPTVWASSTGAAGEEPVAKIDAAKIIDTNGAGDAFVGGFLAALGRCGGALDVGRCCRAGHYAAGVIIQHNGCTFPEKPEYAL